MVAGNFRRAPLRFLASGRAIPPAAANAKLSNLIHGREGINFSGLNKPAPMVVQPLPTHMSRATILHVEDDSNDALLFQHACRKAGMDVNLRVVDDGEQAQAYLKGSAQFQNRDDHPFPTLVVLDLKLGGKATFAMMGEDYACTYKINGDKLALDCSPKGEKVDFTIHDDGSLTGPGFIGVLKKSK